MMSKTLLERAKEYRELVLLAELAGWLHDLGKMSSGFVLSKADRAYATGIEAKVVEKEGDALFGIRERMETHAGFLRRGATRWKASLI